MTRGEFILLWLLMFANFHQRLRVIERDTVCQCGACQTASNLTLKFIAHFGYIKEIKVAQFVKATGIDMADQLFQKINAMHAGLADDQARSQFRNAYREFAERSFPLPGSFQPTNQTRLKELFLDHARNLKEVEATQEVEAVPRVFPTHAQHGPFGAAPAWVD